MVFTGLTPIIAHVVTVDVTRLTLRFDTDTSARPQVYDWAAVDGWALEVHGVRSTSTGLLELTMDLPPNLGKPTPWEQGSRVLVQFAGLPDAAVPTMVVYGEPVERVAVGTVRVENPTSPGKSMVTVVVTLDRCHRPGDGPAGRVAVNGQVVDWTYGEEIFSVLIPLDSPLGSVAVQDWEAGTWVYLEWSTWEDRRLATGLPAKGLLVQADPLDQPDWSRIMRIALDTAAEAGGVTQPAPQVGALLVEMGTGEVWARAHTGPRGRPSAEEALLQVARRSGQWATRGPRSVLVTTLEPDEQCAGMLLKQTYGVLQQVIYLTPLPPTSPDPILSQRVGAVSKFIRPLPVDATRDPELVATGKLVVRAWWHRRATGLPYLTWVHVTSRDAATSAWRDHQRVLLASAAGRIGRAQDDPTQLAFLPQPPTDLPAESTTLSGGLVLLAEASTGDRILRFPLAPDSLHEHAGEGTPPPPPMVHEAPRITSPAEAVAWLRTLPGEPAHILANLEPTQVRPFVEAGLVHEKVKVRAVSPGQTLLATMQLDDQAILTYTRLTPTLGTPRPTPAGNIVDALASSQLVVLEVSSSSSAGGAEGPCTYLLGDVHGLTPAQVGLMTRHGLGPLTALTLASHPPPPMEEQGSGWLEAVLSTRRLADLQRLQKGAGLPSDSVDRVRAAGRPGSLSAVIMDVMQQVWLARGLPSGLQPVAIMCPLRGSDGTDVMMSASEAVMWARKHRLCYTTLDELATLPPLDTEAEADPDPDEKAEKTTAATGIRFD